MTVMKAIINRCRFEFVLLASITNV